MTRISDRRPPSEGAPSKKHLVLVALMAALALFAGCAKTDIYRNAPLDEGSSDSDADSDSDTDVDSDTDSDSEVPPDCVFYVDINSSFGGDGTTWASALDTVQKGIGQAEDMLNEFATCDVWVAEGVYYIYEEGPEDTVALRPDVHVFGGFVGDESLLSQRDWEAHQAVLDGHAYADSYEQVFHVVTGVDDAVLDGFTITGGRALEVFGGKGGGMYNSDASPTVRNCDFVDNEALEGGGMVNLSGSDPLIENCRFYDNIADPTGAAGGISNDNSSPRIMNCRFVGNLGNHGGAMNNYLSSAEITNCVFAFNTGFEGQRTMVNNTATTSITNCVFYDEMSTGVYNKQGAMPEISNTIFWGNLQNGVWSDDESGAVVEYSVIPMGYSGDGNLSVDPLFVDAEDGDFHLQPGSPCIDAADADAAPEFDFEGNPRVDDTATANTGVGPPWADMGAYEYQP